MESDLTHSETLWKAYAWVETHKRQVIFGTVAVVAAVAIAYLLVWQRGQKELNAAGALSEVQSSQSAGSGGQAAAAYLKVHTDYPSTQAGQNALLLGAMALFAEAKHAEALAQFQKFARDYTSSPLLAQARLGIATCQESLGKTTEAIAGYNDVIQRHARSPGAPRAKLQLARLYASQSKAEQARDLLEDLTREERFSIVGSEAMPLLEELRASHPEWAAAQAAATNALPTVVPAITPASAPVPAK